MNVLSWIKRRFIRRPLMYSSRLCEDCQTAKKFFIDNNVPISIKYIEDKGVKKELTVRYGKVLVPTIIISGKKFVGFEDNKIEIRKMLKLD